MSSSSSLIQGISISVSDDDEASGKVRVRVRRKRNHRPVSAGRRFLRRAARWGAPLLLAFLAVSLFAYEYYRLSPFFSSPSSPPPPPRADGNLSRVDRAIRAADGARKSCLKMLDLEMLQNLELPEAPEQSLPVKKVVYRSSLPHLEDNISSNMTNSRFNSFTGYQTLTEREESFKPKEIMTVHCGFYSKNGGFKVSDVDEDYMRSCRVVVATCAFGGGDDLHQPIGMTEVSVKKVCYVAFWDEVTRSAQQEEGNKIGEDLMIGLWRIILVRDLPFTDQRLNGKIPKLISHRLFPTARYSIWVDSKSQFRRDPLGVIEALLWRSNSSLALSEHGARSSLYDEGKAIVKKHKANSRRSENTVGSVPARWHSRRQTIQWKERAQRKASTGGSLWFSESKIKKREILAQLKPTADENDFHSCLDSNFGPEVRRIKNAMDSKCKSILEDLLILLSHAFDSSRSPGSQLSDSPRRQPIAGASLFGADDSSNPRVDELNKTLKALCITTHTLWITWVTAELSDLLSYALNGDDSLASATSLRLSQKLQLW